MQKKLKLKWLLAGSLFSNIGNSFIWPLTTVYMHERLKESLVVVGIVLLFNSLASILGNFVGGRLFDKIQPYKIILAAIVTAGIPMIILIFSNGWPVFPILLIIIGFGNGIILTLLNSLGTTIQDKDGRYVFNMLYFFQNLGNVIGTSMVGFIYGYSFSLLFVIAATLYFLFFIVASRTYRVTIPRKKPAVKKQTGKPQKMPRPNMILIYIFGITLFIVWMAYEQWLSNLSVYMTDLKIPLRNYSLLWTINGGLIVLTQLFINWNDGRILKNIYHQIYLGFLLCVSSFGILLFAHQYWQFILAMCVLTLGESAAFPSVPALVNDLSPYNEKGHYQGLISAFPALGRALGPLAGSLLIEHGSYKLLFIVCMAVMLVFIAITQFVTFRLKNKIKVYE
ncbi:major facilitator superfamily permease [Lactobacillus selangorensis]|uniref:Major facilitator superfamily permease n=1 Tax=Lactobacillus selangorensis TaxID=81857 RepID=A0A0R2FJV4_9LACO|nr:MFS transporter [Lactobacillus selangorensis]KRN28914.1 major facilitator superfamily permease [Lactobacillus selangorensis]KRN32676.1 major facilitator superfamily permease [Lactobacillus selangorensis]